MVDITVVFPDVPGSPRLLVPVSSSQTLLYTLAGICDRLGLKVSGITLVSATSGVEVIDTAWGHDLDYMTRNFGKAYEVHYDGQIDGSVFTSTIERVQAEIEEEKRLEAEKARQEKTKIHDTAIKRLSRLKQIVQASDSIDITRLARITDIDEDLIWEWVFDWARDFGFRVDGTTLHLKGGKIDPFLQYVDRVMRDGK